MHLRSRSLGETVRYTLRVVGIGVCRTHVGDIGKCDGCVGDVCDGQEQYERRRAFI